jgi:Protein of unknown function (DUF998)
MIQDLFACGLVGPILFIFVFLIEGTLRAGYSQRRQYVSELSLGKRGWIQIVNFLIFGLLMVCFSIGIWQAQLFGVEAKIASVLFCVFGLALITAGVFTTDPVRVNSSKKLKKGSLPNLHGLIHSLMGVIVFGLFPFIPFVLTWSFFNTEGWKGLAVYSAATGIVFFVFVFISVSLALGVDKKAPIGLFQRLAIIVGWSWIALLAARLMGLPL